MGSALRKELFGDDADECVEGERTGVEPDGPSEAAHALSDYHTFIDGQHDFEEDAKDRNIKIGRPRGENRPFDEAASEILYRMCAHTEVTAEQTSMLLHYGANPNYIAKGNRGNGPLHLLAKRGLAPAAVSALVAAGGAAHAVNAFNQTPLMLACDTVRTGHTLEIVRILLNHKKGLNLELRDLGGNSALLNSIYKSNPWICRYAGHRLRMERLD